MQSTPPAAGFMRWLLQSEVREPEAPYEKEHTHPQHPWWKVMCLTGVDYFSTLGYQPSIAALAAGVLAPFATLVLVLVTLFGALPMYKRVAEESPHGDGSISMLAHLLKMWQGKLFVLCLLGFVATGFVITITLSAADAAKHLIENPFVHDYLEGRQVIVTLCLIGLLGAVFLKGFNEAIGIAVGVVGLYLALNLVVVGDSILHLITEPEKTVQWQARLMEQYPNPLKLIGTALFFFPALALGLSGFETGVVVMPLVKGDHSDTEERPQGRIRNAKKLLTTAALIMSVLLIVSSFVTTVLVPVEALRAATETAPAGEANGRALAFLAHEYLGEVFGTIFDVSTILILWFAGASALAGLLNIVPRYLPRYGMAPEWARATRPLVLIFTAISFLVTILFEADVDQQAGAYATGVLALMTSATVAVTLSAWRAGQKKALAGFGVITLIFIFTLLMNIFERPAGLKIALLFIAGIIATSVISRVLRTTELRFDRVELDEVAQQFIADVGNREIRIIANKRQAGDEREYAIKEDRQREDSHIPAAYAILFLEVEVVDASEFSSVLHVQGVNVGDYRILRAQGHTVPNAIAALLLHLRDVSGKRPHAYFTWAEGSPVYAMLRYLLFGEGDTAPVTREVLRQAEPDPYHRPMIHVDG